MPSRPRILLIDDDDGIRTVFKLNLQKNGYLLDTAASGKEAIQKMDFKNYDLCFIDIKLPDIEGTELLLSLNELAPDMIKIMITGHPSIDDAIKSLNNGADGFLIKPVKMDELIRAIEKHLEKQSKSKKEYEQKLRESIENKARELESILKFHRPL